MSHAPHGSRCSWVSLHPIITYERLSLTSPSSLSTSTCPSPSSSTSPSWCTPSSGLIDSQGSFSYITPSSDLDIDDTTLGKLLTEAHREYADYRSPEGVSVSQSSLSVVVDRTVKPVGENSSNAQIRTLLDEQRQMIIAEYFEINQALIEQGDFLYKYLEQFFKAWFSWIHSFWYKWIVDMWRWSLVTEGRCETTHQKTRFQDVSVQDFGYRWNWRSQNTVWQQVHNWTTKSRRKKNSTLGITSAWWWLATPMTTRPPRLRALSTQRTWTLTRECAVLSFAGQVLVVMIHTLYRMGQGWSLFGASIFCLYMKLVYFFNFEFFIFLYLAFHPLFRVTES